MNPRYLACVTAVLVFSAGAAFSENLPITAKQAEKGLVSHSKKVPQCAGVKSTKNGVLQVLDYGGAKIDVLYTMDGQKLNSLTMTGPDGARNDSQMRAMMCATIALMLTLQPEYQTLDGAMRDAAHLWKSSAKAPFNMSYYFEQLTAQHVPLQVKAWSK